MKESEDVTCVTNCVPYIRFEKPTTTTLIFHDFFSNEKFLPSNSFFSLRMYVNVYLGKYFFSSWISPIKKLFELKISPL